MIFSEVLFYGGIGGMAFVVTTGIVVVLLMVGRKKSLIKKLEAEYGKIE